MISWLGLAVVHFAICCYAAPILNKLTIIVILIILLNEIEIEASSHSFSSMLLQAVKTHLNDGRYTWRRGSALKYAASSLQIVKNFTFCEDIFPLL